MIKLININSLIFLILFAVSCTEPSLTLPNPINFKDIDLEVSFSDQHFPLIEYQNQIEAEFKVLYFGPKQKKLSIDNFKPISQRQIEKYVTETQNFTHPNILYLLRKQLPKPDEELIKLRIDSTLTYPIILNRSEVNSFHSRKEDTILAHPMLIENVSNNFLEITYSNRINIQLEAQDRNGEWQLISYPYSEFCGTGHYAHPFFPGEIVITSIPVFSGPIKTVARIKVHNYYSHEFPMAVKDEIFIDPF